VRHRWGLGFRQSGFHRVTRVSRAPAIRIFWPLSLSHHAAVPLGFHLKVGWVTQKPHSSKLLPAARGIDDRVKRRTRPAQGVVVAVRRAVDVAGGRVQGDVVGPGCPAHDTMRRTTKSYGATARQTGSAQHGGDDAADHAGGQDHETAEERADRCCSSLFVLIGLCCCVDSARGYVACDVSCVAPARTCGGQAMLPRCCPWASAARRGREQARTRRQSRAHGGTVSYEEDGMVACLTWDLGEVAPRKRDTRTFVLTPPALVIRPLRDRPSAPPPDGALSDLRSRPVVD
jgi:hypothetical protein